MQSLGKEVVVRSDRLLPLIGGAYKARSYIADFELCENLFPEIDPEAEQTPVPVTHYPREGKRPLSLAPTQGPGRGIFAASNGQLFAVVGNSVYFIDQNWVWNLLGKISNATTPVSMADNGTSAVLVDGTAAGYTISLSNHTFAQIFDPTGTFVGSRRVDYSDTFLAFAAPGTNAWYLSNSNSVTFNTLVTANKSSTPDVIQTLAFNIRQAWLFGLQGTEIWYLAGGTPFPYSEWPNVFVPYGIEAPYSLVQADVDLFWLSKNDQGQTIALMSNGYTAKAFSTRALESEWTGYATSVDAIGSTFQQAGHTFIIFHFPTADVSWGYDLATKQWHKRNYIDNNGIAHREKTTFFASVGALAGYVSTIVGQDWATGQIYALDPKFFTDNGQPIVCRRTFPHVLQNMDFLTHVQFVADFETGGISGFAEPTTWDVPGTPTLNMRYSNNGGASFGNYRQKNLVTSGHYRSMMRWRGLGMARDRVYELMWSYPGPSALQGAYVQTLPHTA